MEGWLTFTPLCTPVPFLEFRFFPRPCPALVCPRGAQPQPWLLAPDVDVVLVLTSGRQMNEAKSVEDFPGEVSSFEQDALCFGSAVGLVSHDSGVTYFPMLPFAFLRKVK